MSEKVMELLKEMGTVEFWADLFQKYLVMGPLAPVLLAAMESLIPVLPMVAIVTLNVAAYGPVLGFLYSWIGASIGSLTVFLFFRKLVKRPVLRFANRFPKVEKARKWVSTIRPRALFLILIMPFTPSSFVNFAFGLSDFNEVVYIEIMVMAKIVMLVLLSVFGSSMVQAFENPWYIVLAVALIIVFYALSRYVSKRHHLDD